MLNLLDPFYLNEDQHWTEGGKVGSWACCNTGWGRWNECRNLSTVNVVQSALFFCLYSTQHVYITVYCKYLLWKNWENYDIKIHIDYKTLEYLNSSSFAITLWFWGLGSSMKEERSRNFLALWIIHFVIIPVLKTFGPIVSYTGLDIFRIFFDSILLTLSTKQRKNRKRWILNML